MTTVEDFFQELVVLVGAQWLGAHISQIELAPHMSCPSNVD